MKFNTDDAGIIKEASEHYLYNAIASIKTVAEAKEFFADLCTPMEIQAMADRWRVVPLIKAGMSYRQIYDETGISVTTVGRVARCLMLGTGGYDIIYERIEKKSHEKSHKKSSQVKNSHPKKRTTK